MPSREAHRRTTTRKTAGRSPRDAAHAPAPARRKGPRLGVAKQQEVRTAGGKLGQWWTRPETAAEFARWVGVERQRVIDACAGLGALSIAFLRARAASVIAVELDELLIPRLERNIGAWAPRSRVVCADFFEPVAYDPRQITIPTGYAADVVAGNPVWEDDFPERFLLRAVELAPRACAILPLNVLCGVNRSRVWREQLEPVRARALARRPRFLGAKGGMRDVCFLEVRRRVRPVPKGVPVVVPVEVGA